MDLLVIQLTAAEAIFARFRRQRGTLAFLAGSRHDCGGDAQLAELLASQAAPFREQCRVILALPPALVSLRELELPLADRKKLREVLPLELKGETAMESEELLFDALTLADGKVLAAWAPRRRLAQLIALLADQGVEPEIVTATGFHWQYLLPAGVMHLLACCDGEALALLRDGRPLFLRTLGGSDPARQLAQTVAALELRKGVRIEQLFLHGPAARDRESFALGEPAPLPLPVEGELAQAFAGDEAAARDLAGAYAVVRAVLDGEAVNFRSGPLAYTRGQERLRRSLRLPLILAAILVLLVFAETGVRYLLMKRDLDSLNASIRAIYKEVFPTRGKAVDEVAELRSEIKRLSGAGAASGVLEPLKKLADAKGEEIGGLYEVEIDGEQLRVKGDARSTQAVTDFKGKLASLFAGVEVSEIKSRPDGSVTFSLRATLKEGNR